MDILLERGEKVFITPDYENYDKVRAAFKQLMYENISEHYNDLIGPSLSKGSNESLYKE